jgi:hypothetical protein
MSEKGPFDMTPFDVDQTVPVSYPALISTVDEDGSFTLSPVLPVLIFGLRATADLEVGSKATRNMIRTGECVLNLPSDACVAAVNRLAQLAGTASDPQAESKLWRNHCGKEFQAARLTPAPSEVVSAGGIATGGLGSWRSGGSQGGPATGGSRPWRR